MSNGRVEAPECTGEVNGYVKSIIRVERVSKSGKPYQVLVTTFDNGYELEQFLSNEQKYILGHIPLFKD